MKYLKIIILGMFCLSTQFGIGQNDTTVYTIVEQQPEYPEGNAAFFKFLSMNIKYPQEYIENGIHPRFRISFIVEKDGSIIFLDCLPNNEYWINHFKDILSKMPKWKAGKQNGKLVRVKYTMPLHIRIE